MNKVSMRTNDKKCISNGISKFNFYGFLFLSKDIRSFFPVDANAGAQKRKNDDEDELEKRRKLNAIFKRRQMRTGPSKPGSKEIPKGKRNCLGGLQFVLTGEFESMEREEAEKVIIDLGGSVTKVVSRKTNFIVAGDDAGQVKMAKADQWKITVLSEDDLLDVIRVKSGLSPKNPNSKAIRAMTTPHVLRMFGDKSKQK